MGPASPATPASPEYVTCAMCGSRFEPAQLVSSCEACPMHKGCVLVCCPDCGYSTVDPRRSQVVGLGFRLRQRRRGRRRGGGRGRRGHGFDSGLTLADVPAGVRVRIGDLNGLPLESCRQLQAYGLAPGRSVEVVQQSPVTVVRIEHLDLAFEAEIARAVSVVKPD